MPDIWRPPKPALKAAIAVLRAASSLSGVQVGTDMPNPRPTQFIRVSRIGGGRNIHQDSARLLVECWAATQGGCETLAANASAALHNAAGTTFATAFIYGWGDQQGPVDYPDPDVTEMSRWQFHGLLTVST